MATYKEQIEGRKYFVLMKGKDVLGTFGRLTRLVEQMQYHGVDAKYNTLVRRKDYPIEYMGYIIYHVKHFY